MTGKRGTEPVKGFRGSIKTEVGSDGKRGATFNGPTMEYTACVVSGLLGTLVRHGNLVLGGNPRGRMTDRGQEDQSSGTEDPGSLNELRRSEPTEGT